MELDSTEKTLMKYQQALYTILCEFDRVCAKLEIPYVLFAGTLLGAVRHQGLIPWDDDLDIMMLRKDYDRFLKEADKILDRDRFYLQKEFSEHWPMFFSKLRLNGTTCLEKYHPKDEMIHQGIYIDIFPCDNGLRSELGRKIQFFASKIVIAKSLWKRGYETDSTKKKILMGLCRWLPLKPFLHMTKGSRVESDTVHSFLGGSSKYAKSVYPRKFFTERVTIAFEDGHFPIPAEYDLLLTQLYGDYMTLPPPEERAIKRHAILVDLENSYEEYKDYRNDMTFEVYTRSIR